MPPDPVDLRGLPRAVPTRGGREVYAGTRSSGRFHGLSDPRPQLGVFRDPRSSSGSMPERGRSTRRSSAICPGRAVSTTILDPRNTASSALWGDEDARAPGFVADRADVVLQPLAGERVQRGERLVEQQQSGGRGQRTGDRDPLLLTTGDLPDVAVGGAGEPDPTEQAIARRRPVGFGHARIGEREIDIATDRAPREQPRLLEHHTCALPGHRRRAGHRDRTFGGVFEACDEAKQGALAASGCATLWVPNSWLMVADLPLYPRRQPGMIRRWRCG